MKFSDIRDNLVGHLRSLSHIKLPTDSSRIVSDVESDLRSNRIVSDVESDLRSKSIRNYVNGHETQLPQLLSDDEMHEIGVRVSKVENLVGSAGKFYDELEGRTGGFDSTFYKTSNFRSVSECEARRHKAAIQLLALKELSSELGDTNMDFLKTVFQSGHYLDPIKTAIEVVNGRPSLSHNHELSLISTLSAKAPRLAEIIMCSALLSEVEPHISVNDAPVKELIIASSNSPAIMQRVYISARDWIDCDEKVARYETLPKRGEANHAELCGSIVTDLNAGKPQVVAEAALALAFVGCGEAEVRLLDFASENLRDILREEKVKAALNDEYFFDRTTELQTIEFASNLIKRNNNEPAEGSFGFILYDLGMKLGAENMRARATAFSF